MPKAEPAAAAQESGEEAPPPGAFDFNEFLAEIAPKEATFTFLLNGKPLTGRVLPDAADYVELYRRAEKHQQAAAKSPHPSWKPFLPQSPDVVKRCYVVSEVLTQPKFTFVQCLEMAKKAAAGFAMIAGEVENRVTGAQVRVTEAEVEGNGSGSPGTESGEP